MRGETMKDKSKKSTYSTTFGIDPISFGELPFALPFHAGKLPHWNKKPGAKKVPGLNGGADEVRTHDL